MIVYVLFIFFCVFSRFSVVTCEGHCPYKWPPKRTPQYPYGKRDANETAQRVDEETIEVQVPGTGFPFFEARFKSIFVHMDGIITLGTRQSPVKAMGLPIPDIPAIAPLWTDVDTRGHGQLYVQSGTDLTLSERVTKDIRRAFRTSSSFSVSWALVATWHKVGYFDKHDDKTNSFQCVLATNGSLSFAFFVYYQKKGLEWSAGDADPGLGWTAGVNFGDGVSYIKVPHDFFGGSSLSSLSQKSNVGIPGMWILRVDGFSTQLNEWAVFDECATKPCHNNGVCISEWKDKTITITCSCHTGFSGLCCEHDEDECEAQPCLNGGVCINLPGTFKCNCSMGYSGGRCQHMACGNGVIEQGEACDDGNKNANDGCSSTCQIERLWTCNGTVGELSSCRIKPIDFDSLNPETIGRNTTYNKPLCPVFLADPELLDPGEIRSKDWESIKVVLTNVLIESEQIKFSPELASSSGQIRMSQEEVVKLQEGIEIQQMRNSYNSSMSMKILRKTGKSIDLSSVILSIYYFVAADHTDYKARTASVAVKLNSGALSPLSCINIRYLGQDNNPQPIRLPETRAIFLERSQEPLLVTHGLLSLSDGNNLHLDFQWATVSLSQLKERYLQEELAVKLSCDEVDVVFNPDSLVLYLNGSASSSVYEELLNSVTYINRATKLVGLNLRPVLFRISDGNHVTKAVVYIELQSVVEPPTIYVQGSSGMSFNEGSLAAELSGRVVVIYPDGDTIDSASLELQDAEYGDTISVDFDVLSTIKVIRLSPSQLKLDGMADRSTYGSLISSVTFYNPTANLTRRPRVLTIIVRSGNLTSEPAFITVTVETENSPPVLLFEGLSGKQHWNVVAETHGEPLKVFPTSTQFKDDDSRTASGLKLLMTGAKDWLAEELSFDKDMATEFGLEWTSSWLNEMTYELQVTGHSYFEVYLQVLLSVVYVHNGAMPKGGERTVTVIGMDGEGAGSVPATVQISIQTVNQPPLLNMGAGFGVDDSIRFVRGGEATVRISSRPDRIDIVDQDSSQIANLTIQLRSGNNQNLDLDEYVFVTGSVPDGLTVSQSTDGKSLNFTGFADKGAYMNVLQMIWYANTANEPTLTASDGSQFERWIVIVVCDTGTESGSDVACSVAHVMIYVVVHDSQCTVQQGSNRYTEVGKQELSQPHCHEPETPWDGMQIQAPMVVSVDAFGESNNTFGLGASITVKFSHDVNKPPVLMRSDLQRVLSLEPKEIAMSGHVGLWKDNKTLVIIFPRVEKREGSPINVDELRILFKPPNGACRTAGSCKHAICHAERRSCPVTGIFGVGEYILVEDSQVSLYWFTLLIAGICGCLSVIALYSVVMLARVRCKSKSCLYVFSLFLVGFLCIITLFAVAMLTWI